MGASGQWRRVSATINGANLDILDRVVHPRTAVATALPAAGLLTVNLFTLAAGEMVEAVKMKHRTAFTGGAITAVTAEVGIAGALDRYAGRFNIFQAPADTRIARLLQRGPTLKLSMSNGRNGAGAAAALGLLVGDKVIGLQGLSVAAGYTSAGSEAAGFNSLIPGVAFESIVTVNAQIQQLDAVDRTDGSVLVLAESGGGLESDAAAGTALQLTIRTTGANVSVLTAGVLDVWVKTDRIPQELLGVG